MTDGVPLEELVAFVDQYLGIPAHPDYPTALNGLQVAGPERVRQLCATVDASEAAVEAAARVGAELLLVHHGLFWDGLRPLTGRHYRRVAGLVRAGTALYSAHLPLDGHEEVGNCILLSEALGILPRGRFGSYQGADVGWWGELEIDRDELRDRLASVLYGRVRLIPGGPERVRTVGVITGGGGSFIEEAARAGLDAYVSGEGAHHTYLDAMEHGVNVYYGGHYATETWGVKALAARISDRFGIPWSFLDLPTGL